jgi:hypothetical protein
MPKAPLGEQRRSLAKVEQLVVAGFIDPKPETESLVRDIFREGSVEMFTPDTLDSLRQEIITHGKPAPQGADLFG